MASNANATYIQDLTDFSESTDQNVKSEVAEFFENTHVLVTGGTGFIGKLLIEKLLRSCPGISKIYMIVRPKKGKTPEERFKDNFNDIIYDRLKREQPDALNKVVMLEDDGVQGDFGFTSEKKEMLMKTNVVFHAAAVVRFDEKIRFISNVNVKRTKFLLDIAKQLPNLKAFVYISTAFCQCAQTVTEEAHYKDHIDSDKFLTLIDTLDDDMLSKITPVLLDKWPNTYVLSKALAENIVLKHSDDYPVCIVRPSIVISTSKEPLEAWTNNVYGATGVVMASGIGLLRTLHCIPENIADVIPADYVVSNIICSAWDTYNRKIASRLEQHSNLADNERVPIYNCVSSCQNPISWGDFMYKNELYAMEIPSTKVIWYHMLILQRYLLLHNISAFLLHTVPATVADTLAYISGRNPMCLDTYKKINKFSSVINYFTSRDWKFRNDNVIKLWAKMNSKDREIFCFNVGMLDWDEYYLTHVRGLRTYMLNDPLDTLDAGRRKYKQLKIAHYTLITVSILLVLWLVISFFSFLWSFCPLSH